MHRSAWRVPSFARGVAWVALSCLWACGPTRDPGPGADLLAWASGGETTVVNASQRAFSLSAPNLERLERRVFEVGDSFFNRNWVAAPSSTDARDGLGPRFNAVACSSCHLRDGRGLPPSGEDPLRVGLLHRISVRHGDHIGPHPVLGSQIQDRALPGVPPEGRFVRLVERIAGSFADGVRYELRRPVWQPDASLARRLEGDSRLGTPDSELLHSPRLAPAMVGLGLLEAIPLATLEQWADPTDADGDGISGRVHWVNGDLGAGRRAGRFGWKAAVLTVREQVVRAMISDLGLTSADFPDDRCSASGDGPCLEAAERSRGAQGGAVEVPARRVDQIAFYSSTLAVPARRNLEDPAVHRGAALFSSLECSRCHRPQAVTGRHPIAAVAHQTIHPYTDLLLHDMGEDLADGRPDGEASGSEWRTPPLWGIGLADVVGGEAFFLHDGRARTLEEAILWHGGEGAASRDRYLAASRQERIDLLAFLRSL